jgi:hypothetical protein
MDDLLGHALEQFAAALTQLRQALAVYPGLSARLFSETAEWERLLTYKLLPHFAGEGCLVAAVAGGTNTGKSTVFNLLLGAEISPVRATAAATSRPVLAANAYRAAQGLEGRLAPEFTPLPLDDPEALLRGAGPEDVLYIARHDGLPDRLVLLDIPDVDSIERQHWDLAENIQAAGDVLIAVLTGEKYQDDRVVSFFRRARAAGRVILPLMNKANPQAEYAVARAQLAEFCRATGLDGAPCFVLPHDFGLLEVPDRPIDALDGGPPLRAYLESLDVPAIKKRVYHDSVACFVSQAGEFLESLTETSAGLSSVAEEFETRARTCGASYDPEPGADVGAILHHFIQTKRGRLIRAFGWAGQGVAWVLSPAGRVLRRLVTPSAASSTTSDGETDDRGHDAREVETRTRGLLREYLQTVHNLNPLAAGLIAPEFDAMDVDNAVRRVTEDTVQPGDVSEAFRAHVERTLDAWWSDHALRRLLLLELDALLVLSPAAVAVPLSLYTGGVGVPEMLAATSPLAGEFFARVMEHQFADKWFDLLSPWRREQQDKFARALLDHVARPALHRLNQACDALEDHAAPLRRSYEQCRKTC